MADAGAAKAKKMKNVIVTPSAETSQRILKECSKVTIDIKKVQELFNVNRTNAMILAQAAEGASGQKGSK